ncbi:SCY1-like protein 2 isoform X2 [Neocloeon triangulifer]|uniref:SCY1-like protein 2 isoform X2 n=1 Tax=Neocloeon triangulifer TaxID=2078957 RepID=UPI00286F7E37|nr:SCY1-like protein 2 isoform X2 [Neocloeon triangulifer]
MPASAMFSKFKHGTGAQNVLDNNPILQFFEVGKLLASAGPEMVWKIYDGYRKSDGKEVSVFLFEKRTAEKLHKPKRKETVTEILRASVRQLERFRHPKILQVLHSVEECSETLAFAAEPVYASMANILAYQEDRPQGGPPPLAREYNFLEIELKYGLLQITEALTFLHYSGHVLHRNVCPASILVTKKGTWKLGGLEFTERMNEVDGLEPVPCQPWTSRLPKMAQPDLDYIAPEVQSSSVCSILSDMFSLGMVMCAIFNHGKPLIQANHSSSTYLKQLDLLEDQIHNVLPKVPIPLQEAASRLLSKDTRQRPTAQLLSLIKYFSDSSVHALQFLDVINMKDPTQKAHFYRNTLKDTLPYIPRKLWYQHVWPCLSHEMKAQEVLAAVLQPIIYIIQESSQEEYENLMLPLFRSVFAAPKSIQATVTLLENLHIILEKTPPEDVRTEVLPMLFNAFESSTLQVQSAALVAVTNVAEYLDESAIRKMIMPKTKLVYEKNSGDIKTVLNVLSCVERTLDKLDRPMIIDEVLPLLWDVRLSDPEVILRVVNIYRLMLSDKKFGLSVNLMATRVMPSLLPQTVNPSLNLEQFTGLLEVLQEMLDHIDRNQRNKLKLDNLSLPSPERHRPLRHQFSTDNMHASPPFNIPNLRIEQRKTSSAEDMARKNSAGATSLHGMLGGWWFGGSPSSPDSNFLRVHNAFPPNRRLSDNQLIGPPKIRIAPSCASSPGGTPGGSGGLPIRRHSSIGPQERRGSTMNLSPPTASSYHSVVSRDGSRTSLTVPAPYLARSMIGGSMPNTSSSVPFLLSSSMSSIRSGGSRRTSACLGLSGSPGASSAGLLQQLGSGMVRTLSSAASSAYSYSPYSSQHHSPRGSFSSQGGASSNVSSSFSSALAQKLKH